MNPKSEGKTESRKKANVQTISASVPKGMVEKIQMRAYLTGHASTAAYIRDLIRSEMGTTLEEWKKAGE